MFGPDWNAGCPHCSRWADNFNSIIVHLNQRDVTMIAVSRAPYAKLAAYRKRDGLDLRLVLLNESDFNFDYHVSFTPDEIAQNARYTISNVRIQKPPSVKGVSIFFKDDAGNVFHTYSAYARGIDLLSADYNYLDLVPKGRDENGRGPYWVRRHDEYDKVSPV